MVWSKNSLPVFIYENEAFSGVKKIADYVRRDMELVFDKKPEIAEVSEGNLTGIKDACKRSNASNTNTAESANSAGLVIFGTLGRSPVIDRLVSDGIINIEDIKEKREVFKFLVIENTTICLHNSDASKISASVQTNLLIITGSDKRGTIYGLFHLSKLLGVSPFIDWSDLKPQERSTFELTDKVNFISKEPSVKYRGFFINDEWPAFGNFAMKRFGGINAKLYEVIFTMLLRMNGNYLWPAMWASCFAVDGPGLESACLADEYGVVMGLSHHEPCLRHGEEYSHLRGKDSIYGDAWNFRTNRDGIIRFWRDGLKRNGHLENVITIGMRGERDSSIMGKNATLADNIELLRDVINTQNELIKEEVNPDLAKVPRMLALYKEVEPFYFGDETTKGLAGDECLDGVILLLCDDNHGYLRSRPMSYENGYGLYYHFDYHGDPVSYEWVNSTYLPEVWEELTEAYETGIRDLFIVNVGDVGFNEFALNYFLDFAYDYEKWGIDRLNATDEYTRQWFYDNFSASFDEKDIDLLAKTWTKACRLNHRRRPEHMNADIYPANDFTNTLDILNETKEIVSIVSGLENKCAAYKDAFIQLISFQLKASMNMIQMWIYKGFNRFAAERGMYVTNAIADRLNAVFDIDKELTELVHTINNGRYYGLALANHIGFKHWNDEESTYPSAETIRLFDRSTIVAGVEGSDLYTTGQEWSKKRLRITDINKCRFYIALCGTKDAEYKIVCDDESIKLSETEGKLTAEQPYKIVTLGLHNATTKAATSTSSETASNTAFANTLNHTSAAASKAAPAPIIHILSDGSDIEIEVDVSTDGHIYFESSDYTDKFESAGEHLITLDAVGNTSDGVKLYKDSDRLILVKAVDSATNNTKLCSPAKTNTMTANSIISASQTTQVPQAPSYLSYDLSILEDSIYRCTFKFLPCNPRNPEKNIYFAYRINESDIRTLKVLKPGYQPGVSKDWEESVLTHERNVECLIELKKGQNRLYYYPLQAENVLLSIFLTKIMTV